MPINTTNCIQTPGPNVSVIISTFNRPFKLVRAIKSVQAQTYKNLEIVVVGDCCRPDTEKAINANFSTDSRIRYFNLEKPCADQGTTPKNKALELSVGEYIAYLDDDDVYFPEHIEKSVQFLLKNRDIDLVYGCSKVFKFISPDRSVIRDRAFSKSEHDRSPFINTCEIVHRRVVLDKIQSGWWRNVGYFNDYDFLKRVSYVGRIEHSKHLAATQHFPHSQIVRMETQRIRRTKKDIPKLSVIIGVRGRTKYLAECIKAFNKQIAPRDSYEIIVIDQGNGHESKIACSNFEGRIIHTSLYDDSPFHRGWVCNVGAKHAISDNLCFLDCDCIVTPEFIQTILSCLEKQPDKKYIIRLKRKFLLEAETDKYFSGELAFSAAYESCGLDPNESAVGSGTCVSRSEFFSLRGFDERYDKGWGFEDVDLYDRFLANGCRLVEDFQNPIQMHLWHGAEDHKKIHRGDHYLYYKQMSRNKTTESYLRRNLDIDWGEILREKCF